MPLESRGLLVSLVPCDGPFQLLDDLQNVLGTGEKTVANNKGKMAISQGTSGQKNGMADTAKKAKQASSAKP